MATSRSCGGTPLIGPPADGHRARIRLFEPRDDPQQRRFAAAAGTDDDDDLARSTERVTSASALSPRPSPTRPSCRRALSPRPSPPDPRATGPTRSVCSRRRAESPRARRRSLRSRLAPPLLGGREILECVDLHVSAVRVDPMEHRAALDHVLEEVDEVRALEGAPLPPRRAAGPCASLVEGRDESRLRPREKTSSLR
jgi:hypothetical protein